MCGPLIRLYGWPSVFHLFAILGFAWCCFWPFLKPDLRDAASWRSKSIRQKQKFYEDRQSKRQVVISLIPLLLSVFIQVPWSLIVKSSAVWAIIIAHFCFNWGYYTLLAWLPSFFELALHLNVQSSSILTVIPYLAMTLMTPLVVAPQPHIFSLTHSHT